MIGGRLVLLASLLLLGRGGATAFLTSLAMPTVPAASSHRGSSILLVRQQQPLLCPPGAGRTGERAPSLLRSAHAGYLLHSALKACMEGGGGMGGEFEGREGPHEWKPDQAGPFGAAHFINLSNGAESLPLLKQLGVPFSFTRMQSSHCESQNFDGILSNLGT